jgi:hypothetical protein
MFTFIGGTSKIEPMTCLEKSYGSITKHAESSIFNADVGQEQSFFIIATTMAEYMDP